MATAHLRFYEAQPQPPKGYGWTPTLADALDSIWALTHSNGARFRASHLFVVAMPSLLWPAFYKAATAAAEAHPGAELACDLTGCGPSPGDHQFVFRPVD